jgi:hypothetical protein
VFSIEVTGKSCSELMGHPKNKKGGEEGEGGGRERSSCWVEYLGQDKN